MSRLRKAGLLVLVADSQAGITPLDEELARLLRGTGKPFVVAVNKVDAQSQESLAAAFHRLGVPVFPIAAEHGSGVDDLLDAALAQFFPGEQQGALEPAADETGHNADSDENSKQTTRPMNRPATLPKLEAARWKSRSSGGRMWASPPC